MSRTQTKQSTAFFITSLFTKNINYVNSLKHHYQNTFLWVALILLMNRAINSGDKNCTLVKQTIGMAKEGMLHHLGSPANLIQLALSCTYVQKCTEVLVDGILTKGHKISW